MKIYRNNVAIEMDLEEFLNVIESDMLDDLLLVVMELDDSHKPGELSSKTWAKPVKQEILPLPKEIKKDDLIVEDLDELMDYLESIGLSEDDVDIQVWEYEGEYDDIPQSFWDQFGDGWEDFGPISSANHWVGDLDGESSLYYTTYDEKAEGLTDEDRRIRRILNRYRYMTE